MKNFRIGLNEMIIDTTVVLNQQNCCLNHQYLPEQWAEGCSSQGWDGLAGGVREWKLATG